MDFFRERDMKMKADLDRILLDMPPFCQMYFFGKEQALCMKTKQNCAFVIREFFNFLSKDVDTFDFKHPTNLSIADLRNILVGDVERYIEYLSVSNAPSSIGQQIYTLNSFFKYFVKIGEILYNPIARIDIPARKEKPVVRLTQDEIRKVLAAVDSGYRKHNGKKRLNKKYILRDKTILVLFLSTGIRLSELIGLDRGNIDMDNASFEVQRKGGRREVCYMTAELVEHIKIYLQSFPKASPREPMFMNLYNHRISTASVQRMVQSYCKVAGVTNKITPHKLRSTFGTSMYEKTRDIYLVSELLGHKDVRTTRTHYTTIKEEIKREALTGFQIV